jgi:hypothetical protein
MADKPAIRLSSAVFDKAVAELKSVFKNKIRLVTEGQFYVTWWAGEQLVGQAENELFETLSLAPLKREHILKLIKGLIIGTPVSRISPELVQLNLDSLDRNNDLAGVKRLFETGTPSQVELGVVRAIFEKTWGKSDINEGDYYVGSRGDFKTLRAAFNYDKVQCFKVCRGFANKLLVACRANALPKKLKLSAGLIAQATLIGKPATSDNAKQEEQQIVNYGAPSQLRDIAKLMREVLDFGGVIQCGVLSGVRLDKNIRNDPEHYILVIAHDVIDGQEAFLFWDPDPSGSDVEKTLWGPGFGVLFSRAGRLTTAIDDDDLKNLQLAKSDKNFGDHLTLPHRRHCYQVFWIQTLPV